MDDKLFDKIIREATWQEARGLRRQLKHYTSTWEHKPKWAITSKRLARRYQTSVTTTDQRFIWVEKGTKRRYRVLSPNWSSKSQPGSLSPRAGSGKALGFYRNPKPGIKPRNNLETLAEVRRKIFPLVLAIKINAAAPRLFN